MDGERRLHLRPVALTNAVPEHEPQPSPSWSTRTKSVVVIAAQVANGVFVYGSLLIAGRFFAPESYGLFNYVLGSTTLLAILSDLGLGFAHQRAVARGQDRGRALTALVVLRGALILLVVGAFALWWSIPGLHRGLAASAGYISVVVVVICIQIVLLLRSLVEATWLGEQRAHLVEALRLIDSIVTLAVLANVAVVVATLQGFNPPFQVVARFWMDLAELNRPITLEEGAVLLAASYLVGRVVTLGIALRWAKRDKIRFSSWDAGMARQFIREAIPLSLAFVMALLLTSADVFILGSFLGPLPVAFYVAAQRIATVAILATGAVSSILFPRFAQLHSTGDLDGLEATSLEAHRYLLLIAAPVAAAMLALPGNGLVAVMGPAYLPAAAALRWLAGWALLIAVMNPLTARLIGEGQDRTVVAAGVLNAVLNITLNLAFVPPQGLALGAQGAAMATFLSTGIALGYLAWRTRLSTIRSFAIDHSPKILLAAFIVGLGWWAAGNWLPQFTDQSLELLAWGILGLVVYGGLARLFGLLGDKELALVSRFLRPAS